MFIFIVKILLEIKVLSIQPKVTSNIDVEPSDNQKLTLLKIHLFQYLFNFLSYLVKVKSMT